MNVDDLHKWLVSGLTACTMESASGQQMRPAMAFSNARLSFGQRGDHRTPVEELTALFAELDDVAKDRFHQAIEKAIDRLPVEPRTMPVLDALIELGLDTKCNLAVDAVEKKLSVPSSDARRLLYLHAAFLLEESDAPIAVLKLAHTMMNTTTIHPILRRACWSHFVAMTLMRLQPTPGKYRGS